jgi:alpha-beta hydrolase superfamily lysophospholipase
MIMDAGARLGDRYGLELFGDNPSWLHQLIRLLAEVEDGGGDFFEILEIASGIKPNDHADWFVRWYEAGDRNYRRGLIEERRGNAETARGLFLRACNYFRMADFYLESSDRREISVYGRVVKSFSKAATHFDHRFEEVVVPYGDTSMSGYFLGPARRERTPVVILFGGADSLKEEYYFRGARQILERGMACLLVDGPGQGDMLRLQGKCAPYDYERPISSVVDYLVKRKDVDGSRIGLVASSLGGYFGVRAAAFEKRIAAAVAWSAVYDVLSDVYDFFPPIQQRIRWVIGADSDSEARKKLSLFNLKGVVKRVRCPLLILHGEEDYIASVEGALRVYREAACPKTLRIFKKGERGSSHAQQDNLGAAKSLIFDWIREKLARGRS